jgi:hypothetical protein
LIPLLQTVSFLFLAQHFSARRHELTAAAGDVVIFDLRTISFLAQHVSARRQGLGFLVRRHELTTIVFFCRLVSISCATP